MITNERQYRITKSKLSEFMEAVNSFDMYEATRRTGSPVLAKAEIDALRSELDVLSDQLKEYAAVKSGAVTVFEVDSLEALPVLLIRARIAKGMSQRQLAEVVGLKEQQIQRYESDRYTTANLRQLEEVATALELDISGVAELGPTRSRDAKSNLEVQWELFPVKEMYKRQWFKGFDGSLSDAMAHRVDLARAFVQQAMPRRQPVFLRHKARFGAEMDTYSIWAWQCRITLLAQDVNPPINFSRSSLSLDWFRELVKLSRKDDGPRRAQDILREIGIHLVVEPHLPQTYLDGAAFLLSDGSPVIGMTLRYDRLDNFWFVLIHELVHVRDHLRKGKLEFIFDDLESQPDELEKKTDQLAGDIMIADVQWETALPRYLRTEASVIDFAQDIGVHPAIVAGRIRKEADNYIILSNLVGLGELRKQFPDVQFAQ